MSSEIFRKSRIQLSQIVILLTLKKFERKMLPLRGGVLLFPGGFTGFMVSSRHTVSLVVFATAGTSDAYAPTTMSGMSGGCGCL